MVDQITSTLIDDKDSHAALPTIHFSKPRCRIITRTYLGGDLSRGYFPSRGRGERRNGHRARVDVKLMRLHKGAARDCIQ